MGVPDQLRIDVRHEPGRVVLALSGELDMASAELLQKAVEEPGAGEGKLLLLDLQQLQFIDSTGLRAILTTLEHCRERGQEFAITPGSQQVQRLLSITGVAEHLPTLPATGEMVA
jgi:anti-sigma B factor antagonist